MKKRTRLSLSTTHVILFSFLAVILFGALLLMLPISSRTREWTSFVDALFTSTTATCVTGLVVLPTVTAWSIFGQIVILLLIQIGGLGVITVLTAVSLFLHRRIGLSRRLLLQDAFNLNSLSGLVTFVKKVVRGTLLVEGVGALLYMTVFVPQFGLRGIWMSVFHSVSAFCNAGIDILGTNSFCDYATHPVINAITSLLIILGGIGYIVWWDVIRVFRERKTHKGALWTRLTLHSKIVLSFTLLLLIGGTVLIFLFEKDNPLTLGRMTTGEKLMASFFQSVTTRTAGFATIPQEHLTSASALVSLLLMFIGGSPVGTAGGIKTATFVVLFAAATAAIRNRNDVKLFSRRLSTAAIRKAIGVTCTSFMILFASAVSLALCTDAPLIDVLFETVSATATVGLSRNLTASLDVVGRLIITATMYLGRVGPISLAFAFNLKQDSPNLIKDPIEEISVG